MNIILLLLQAAYALVVIASIILYCIILSYLNIYFDILLIFCTIYLIARFICRLMVFPGSNQLFLKYVFSYDYNIETIYLTIKHLKQYKNFDLKDLKKVENAKKHFQTQFLIFQKLEGILNSQQKKYFALLSKFIGLINDNNNIDQIQEQYLNIYRFLDDYLEQSCQIRVCLRPLLLSHLFGTLEQYREELIIDNPNIFRHTITNKNNQIDCIYIVNNKSNSPTVLFCNPNGLYYEYAFKNQTIFKAYQSMKVNVILWNYCGYGCSTGTVSTQNIIECGKVVAQYFKKKYHINKMGVHGYSIGGMVASEIAYSLNLSFLIADRTFSSLGQIAYIKFNSFARFLLNCVVDWDQPNFLSYQNFKGPKMIIQNINDEMIPYLAQLQASLVRQFFTNNSFLNQESKQYMNYFFQNILSQNSTNLLNESLQVLIKKGNQQNNGNNPRNQQVKNQVVPLLSKIKYCNNSIIQVLNQNSTPEKIIVFFGSFFIFERNSFAIIKEVIMDIHQLLQQEQRNQDILLVTEDERQLLENIQQIKENIEEINNKLQTNITLRNLSARTQFKQFGHLMAINSGHNQNLNVDEEQKFCDYFMSNLCKIK